MSTAPFSPALYYKHSGRLSFGGVLAALAIGILIGAPLAWLYAWFIHWNPFIYVSILASAGFGAIVGMAVEKILEGRKCRNVVVAGVVSFLVMAVSFYLSWAVWLATLINGTISMFLNPLYMVAGMLAINKHGAWSLRGSVVSGAALWAVWAMEAVFVLGMAVYLAVHELQEATYCEGCDKWTKEQLAVCLAGAGAAPELQDKANFKAYLKNLKPHAADLKLHLEAKDFSYLEQLGAVSENAIAWYRLDLHSCPGCNMTHTLRLTQFKRKVDGKKIKNETDEKEILRQLLLGSSEADSLVRLGTKMVPLLPSFAVVRDKKETAKAAAAGK